MPGSRRLWNTGYIVTKWNTEADGSGPAMRSGHDFPRNSQNSHQRAMYIQEEGKVTRPTRTEKLTVVQAVFVTTL